VLSVSLASVVGCAPPTPDWPPFVDQLITELQTSPTKNPPASIWRYKYKGLEVFYVPPYCCDVAGALYDSNGSVVCGPDGGLTGKGDGRCPDFFSERTEELRVWADER
jgi:hypothetical protein